MPFTEDEARKAVLDVAREHQIPPRIQLALTADTSIPMRLIPPGSLPIRGRIASVRLPYYMTETEITHAQLSGSGVKDDYWKPAPSLPACFDNVDDIKTYLDYVKDRCGVDIRLPTEPEWEFAARAGSAGRYGPGSGDPTQFANIDTWNAAKEIDGYERRGQYADVPGNDLIPVASFPANAFGIHDAIGNVAEVVHTPKDLREDGDGLFVYTKGGEYLYSGGFAEREMESKWSFAAFVGLRLVITVDDALIERLSKKNDGWVAPSQEGP